MNELALFAGAGGGILGSHLMGWRTVCAVEREAYPAQVLAQRQNDGILPPFPIWSDVLSFDGKPWRGIVDVISGGFPCQDISSAGKGAGIDGARSGMWSQMARIISEVRPRFVFVENSPMLVSRGLARVISDLTQMGYDTQWARFSASNFGAPHQRDRLWIVANAKSKGCSIDLITERLSQKFSGAGVNSQSMANTKGFGLEQTGKCKCSPSQRIAGCCIEFSNANCFRCKQMEQSVSCRTSSQGLTSSPEHSSFTSGWKWWAVEPGLGRVADGVAHRVDRLKAIGNGQVSIVAVNAYKALGAKS
ncbi:DNA cytosine methyltransferase [Acinetobacter johnsonii]|uniref:DNA (cytosine-5-)-methyltransferase n=1 Tax=Acinetobacter johnsonii TaxID=40214 RepID=A0A3R9FLW3_ACIJO|nr:DNA cytosine methyltransferase [Acinetobacter johnsonii]RSE16427.1 DNA cytosine methyltransferase [Acinetobacter johnsonii]